MNHEQHRKLNEQYTRQRNELEQAYWHAVVARTRPGLSVSNRQRWREHAERAADSLRRMGVHVGEV